MILVIDNYDSFTYNLVQYLGQCGAEIVVKRNDEVTIEEISAMMPSGIMLSPGPCTPKDSKVCLDILRATLDQEEGFRVPLFGVCLGHQAIGEVTGSPVVVAATRPERRLDARLPAHLEVSGLLRAVEGAGGFAMVLHKGEREAGTIAGASSGSATRTGR